MLHRSIALVLVCAISSPLFAQAAAPATGATAEKPAEEKKVCRREETTGSIMTRRVCHTKAEWAQIDEPNQRANDQFNNARRSGTAGH